MKQTHGLPPANAPLNSMIRGKVNAAKWARIIDGRNRAERRRIDKAEKRREKGK